jgi:tight adherence protein B
MGAVIGLAFGLGALLLWLGVARPRTVKARSRTRALLEDSGYPDVRPGRVYGLAAVLGLLGAALMTAVSRSAPIGVAFGSFFAVGPFALVRARRRQRLAELRDVWPDAIDHLASGVRAGLSLPEACLQLADRGPALLREPFRRFGDEYRATGRFGDALDRLKADLAHPVGDRVVETLRLAREVGGTDLGRLLRTLSQFLRTDARTRAELEARQTWTVNAARLALAAPWVLLGLMSFRPHAVAAYNTPEGVLVLLGGALVSVAAYRLMLRLGRLPQEPRTFR